MPEHKDRFPGEVNRKEKRKLDARGRDENIWFGLGMFGVVGWSIALPLVIGALLGLWIDSRWPSRYSWALMLMVIGLFLGCFTAWNWIEKERRDNGAREKDQGGG